MTIQFTLRQADIKEASKLALARAQSMKINMSYQQMLEIISAGFGAQSYHQIAPAANGELHVNVFGKKTNLYELIDLALDTCGPDRTLRVACRAASSCGEVSLCEYTFDRESLRALARWIYQDGSSSDLSLNATFHDSEYTLYEEAHGDHQRDNDEGKVFILHASSTGKHAGGRAWTTEELNVVWMIEGLVLPLARKAKGESFQLEGFAPFSDDLIDGPDSKEYRWASPIRFADSTAGSYIRV